MAGPDAVLPYTVSVTSPVQSVNTEKATDACSIVKISNHFYLPH